MRVNRIAPVLPLLLAPVLLASATFAAQDTEAKVSEFGRYEGWSEERFSEWTTFSRYLEMCDGVKLAIHVTRPAVDGVPVRTEERRGGKA